MGDRPVGIVGKDCETCGRFERHWFCDFRREKSNIGKPCPRYCPKIEIRNREIEQAITEAMAKHAVAMEGLTAEQLASVVAQAIACGDIARYTAPAEMENADQLNMTITERSQVVYVPNARVRQLQAANDMLLELLWLARRHMNEWSGFLEKQEAKQKIDAVLEGRRG